MNIKTELLKNRIIDIIKSNMNDFEIDEMKLLIQMLFAYYQKYN